MYDSRPDTLKHIETVQMFISEAIDNLAARANDHDKSKLEGVEKEVFDEVTPKLAAMSYGSTAYVESLAAMKPALDHHYANNKHHPEHWPGGIRDMSLLDVLEMLCDWRAAVLRHNDGDIMRSIALNQRRFDYSDELKALLINTIRELTADK